ncbi:MAG: hypothetical protein ACYC2G_11195 [Gemmatimonadaceae bacterium]
MPTVFLVAALFGGAVLVLQLLLGVIGLEGGHDVGQDGVVDGGLQLLTVRGVAAALTFFGIAGRAVLALGGGTVLATAAGVAAGGAAAVGVAAVMRQLGRLESDGVIRIERSVGLPGVVHVSLPGDAHEAGKIMLTLQDRRIELKAVSLDGELPTGTPVTVVGLAGHDTVEVVRTPEPGA